MNLLLETGSATCMSEPQIANGGLMSEIGVGYSGVICCEVSVKSSELGLLSHHQIRNLCVLLRATFSLPSPL